MLLGCKSCSLSDNCLPLSQKYFHLFPAAYEFILEIYCSSSCFPFVGVRAVICQSDTFTTTFVIFSTLVPVVGLFSRLFSLLCLS